MSGLNRRGFTLVELLVTLAILGLLAGIGVPQYMRMLERAREAADEAIIAVVQSAVDGYLSETGVAIANLQKEDQSLDENAQAPSILNGTQIELREFLDSAYVHNTDGLPPHTAFKSAKYRIATGKWIINAQGKVTFAE